MSNLAKHIRTVHDFPKPGIGFKDITTLLKDGAAFKASLDEMQRRFAGDADVILGIESRGFIFGAALADRMGLGFVPARKPGKLPAAKIREEYALEYGTDALEMHEDALEPGQRVLIVDDLLATGGTAAAVGKLVKKLNAEIAGYCFLIELSFLNGRQKLGANRIEALITYDSE